LFPDLPHPEHLEAMMVEDMKAAGLDPAFIHAFEKTGLLVTQQNQHLIPEKDLAEWDAAPSRSTRRRTGGGVTDLLKGGHARWRCTRSGGIGIDGDALPQRHKRESQGAGGSIGASIYLTRPPRSLQ
jgi:hypothetical protein